MGRVKRWIILATVVWGVVIAGLGYYSLRNDPPTAREQTTIAEALPYVDAAIADVASTLEPDTTVAAVSGYNRVGRSCSVTVAREGTRYERVITVYTKEGSEPALLDRIRNSLPERYKAGLSRNMLSADAGNFVAVRGGVTGPGQVRIAADTGCRVHDARVQETESSSGDSAPVQSVLDALKVTAKTWQAFKVACPSGNAIWTVAATAAAPPALPDSLRPASGVVLAKPDVLAFRSGPAGVAVRITDGTVTVTSTTGC
jgi:hypothetical protein